MKKVISLFLCFAMALCICGCGGSGDDTSSDIFIIEHEQIIVDQDGNQVSSEQTPSASDPTTSTPPTSNNSSNDNDSTDTPVQSTEIDFNKTVEVDICDDVIRGYLSATTPAKQFFWLNEYNGQHFDYQTLEIDWNYDGSSQFTLWISENADFSNSTKSIVKNMYLETTTLVPGKTYYWKVTGNITDKALGGGKIKVKDAPVRWINIEGSGNVRDMGGWKTESGKTVRYEMLYRGKALDSITEAGIATVKQLGFKTEIDIRHTGNNPTPPTIAGMNYKFLNTTAQYDMIFSSNENTSNEVKTNYKEIFKLLSNKNNYPIFTHCSAGADRTGTYAFILNGLLGVSYEDLTRDFELTSFSSSGKRWRGKGAGGTFAENDLIMQEDGGNYVAWGVLYEEMMEKYGTSDGKLSTAIERWLITYCGVPKAQIDSFKAIMLE